MKRRYGSTLFDDIWSQPYSDSGRVRLYNSTKNSLSLVQRLGLLKKLPIHSGCVNTICWNETGEYILSGSDDQHLLVTHGHTHATATDVKTAHRANIFSARFMPGGSDDLVVSCAGDGIILLTDLNCPVQTSGNSFNCHSGTTYEVTTIPNDPHAFLSCGEDGTVRWFDTRQKTKCSKRECNEDVLISCQRAVTTLTVNPLAPYQLAIGCSDSRVRMYDRRMLGTRAAGDDLKTRSAFPLCSFTAPKLEDRNCRITSLNFSPEAEQLLVSFSSDHLYLFSVKDSGSPPVTLSSADRGSTKPRSRSRASHSSPPVRRLRLRGDWSDTGPDARPEREARTEREQTDNADVTQDLSSLMRVPPHATLMQRMTDVLSRMLNDPATRAALNNNNNNTADLPLPDTGSPAMSRVEMESRQRVMEEGRSLMEAGRLMSRQCLRSPGAGGESEAVSYSTFGNSSSSARPVNATTERDGSQQQQQSPLRPVLPERVELSQQSLPGTSYTLDIADTSDTHSQYSPLAPRCDVSQQSQQLIPSETVQEGSQQSQQSIPSETLQSGSQQSQQSIPSETDQDSSQQSQSSIPSVTDQGYSQQSQQSIPSVTDQDSSQQSQPLPVPMETGPGGSEQMCHIGTPYESDPCSQRSTPAMRGWQHLRARVRGNVAAAVDVADPDDAEVSSDSDEHSPRPGSARECSGMDPREDENDGGERPYCSRRPTVAQTFTGHRNARTMIKEACFWGTEYVMSGSDCGHVFVWDRRTARLVALLPGDRHVVNCLQPHPTLPLLATSGIDYDVKLWAPVAERPDFDQDFADALMERNEVMLEETRDTITVPASFMIRMLACLNQIRRGTGRVVDPAPNEEDENDNTE